MTTSGNLILVRPYRSPCGEMTLGAFGGKLCLCDWARPKHPGRTAARLRRLLRADFKEGDADVLRETAAQLDAYFRRERAAFSVPLLFAGTDFQKKIWTALTEIPCGETVSYGELARRVGMPAAVRAAANAVGANALAVVVPCHRVVGSDRSLTGYAGGLAAKKFLLDSERNLRA